MRCNPLLHYTRPINGRWYCVFVLVVLTLTRKGYQWRAVISGNVHWTVLCSLSVYCAECHLLACTLTTGEWYSVVNVPCVVQWLQYTPMYTAVNGWIWESPYDCPTSSVREHSSHAHINLMYGWMDARTSTMTNLLRLPNLNCSMYTPPYNNLPPVQQTTISL